MDFADYGQKSPWFVWHTYCDIDISPWQGILNNNTFALNREGRLA